MKGLLRAVYLLPLLGILVREAVEGPDDAKLVFLINVAMVICLMVIFFGFPALMMIAFSGAAVIFALLLSITFHQI